ncbi:PGDYG domain-containing protein [Massilia jejuensis]|uniref:PGDYG domain-containing protein n=1 Tax=Massilia jejuensis TaxID=648894 RepID=A0ABW0PIP4_9BURK
MREYRAGRKAIFCDTPAAVKVGKIPSRVFVRFVEKSESIITREGCVPAHPGDAVVTAATGEQWPVVRAVFDRYYEPTSEATVFSSIPRESLALQINGPFQVILTDGISRLFGKPGDWLLDYGDGHLGIVGADIFATIYRRLD